MFAPPGWRNGIWTPAHVITCIMLNSSKVNEIALAVARSNLGEEHVHRAFSEPATASDGSDALKITVVIEPDSARKLKDDAVLNTLVALKDTLENAGEERLAMVEYATEEELTLAGSES